MNDELTLLWGDAVKWAIGKGKDAVTESQNKIDEFENARVRCGLIGNSGTGKSSLINAIANGRIAEVGVVETTTDPNTYEHLGVIYTDLPGCGTQKWPRDTYVDKLKLSEYDCFLLVTAQRFTENDLFLFRELTAMNKPCFVIRNMIDRAIEDGEYDNNHSEDETKRIITKDILSQIGDDKCERIYLVSTRRAEVLKHDLSQLLEDVSERLEGVKRDRFVMGMAAYDDQAFQKKRELAIRHVKWYSLLAAANGINPVPGLDVGVDFGILMKLSRQIAQLYGLTDEQVAYSRLLFGGSAVAPLASKLTKFGIEYLTDAGVKQLLKRIGGRVATKEAVKFVPVVGYIVAGGLGWGITYRYGVQCVNDAETNIKNFILEIRQKQSSN